ncbi:MAG TPA: TlpA disulfide reductase family protein [Candidatus Baltobacteraceae bacterium]|nr:TlpA disulfide reductase family protein [Candidatus Baltobacteraceae bacterium]
MLAVLVAAAIAGTGLKTVQFGAPPPDFSIPVTAGAPTVLSHLRGKPVVINFWASWCPPCTQELPYFQRLQDEYGTRVRIITIDWNEDAQTARTYLRSNHYSLPLVLDSDSKIYAAYSLTKVPDTIVLDANGNVTYVSVGGLSWDELAGAVDPLM